MSPFICRNGRFILRSLKNIISSKTLLECEEALNQGSITAAKAFINLRRNSILHLFACIGRFLGLEVCLSFETLSSFKRNCDLELYCYPRGSLLSLQNVLDF